MKSSCYFGSLFQFANNWKNQTTHRQNCPCFSYSFFISSCLQGSRKRFCSSSHSLRSPSLVFFSKQNCYYCHFSSPLKDCSFLISKKYTWHCKNEFTLLFYDGGGAHKDRYSIIKILFLLKAWSPASLSRLLAITFFEALHSTETSIRVSQLWKAGFGWGFFSSDRIGKFLK